MNNLNFDIIALVVAMICAGLYCYTATFFWQPKLLNKFFIALIGSVFIGCFIWWCAFLNNEILHHVLLLLVEMIFLKIFTQITYVQALFAAITSRLHTLCIYSIVIGCFSLYLQKNMFNVISSHNLSMMLLSITMLLKAFILYVYTNKKMKRKLSILFSTEHELINILFLHITMFIFMLFYSYNFYYNLDLIWLTISQVITALLILIAYSIILYHGIKISSLLTEDILNDEIKSQLETQLSNYKAHKDFVSLNEYNRHNLKETLLTLENVLDSNNISQAKKIVKEEFSQLINSTYSHPVFSNNEIIDAALFEWQNLSLRNNINFEGQLYLPMIDKEKENHIIKLLAISKKIFFLLCTNTKKSSIKISSATQGNLIILNISGTFVGQIGGNEFLPSFMTKDGKEIKKAYHNLNTIAYGSGSTISWSCHENIFQIKISIF